MGHVIFPPSQTAALTGWRFLADYARARGISREAARKRARRGLVVRLSIAQGKHAPLTAWIENPRHE